MKKNFQFSLLQKIQPTQKKAETLAHTVFEQCNKLFFIPNLLHFVTLCYTLKLYRIVTSLTPCYTLNN